MKQPEIEDLFALIEKNGTEIYSKKIKSSPWHREERETWAHTMTREGLVAKVNRSLRSTSNTAARGTMSIREIIIKEICTDIIIFAAKKIDSGHRTLFFHGSTREIPLPEKDWYLIEGEEIPEPFARKESSGH